MEEKKSFKISLSTFFLIIAIIIIIIMAIYICIDKSNSNKEVSSLEANATNMQAKIDDLQEKIDSISNIVDTNSISEDNSTTTSYNTTNSTENNSINSTSSNLSNNTTNENSQNTENSDLIGTWNTVSAVNTSTWNYIDNLTEVFGSSYITYGSSLKLNSDGSFIDSIYPITSGEESTTGTYTINKSYYVSGDRVIILNYSDGKQKIFKVIYEKENIPSLMMDVSAGEAYQFNMEKQ